MEPRKQSISFGVPNNHKTEQQLPPILLDDEDNNVSDVSDGNNNVSDNNIQQTSSSQLMSSLNNVRSPAISRFATETFPESSRDETPVYVGGNVEFLTLEELEEIILEGLDDATPKNTNEAMYGLKNVLESAIKSAELDDALEKSIRTSTSREFPSVDIHERNPDFNVSTLSELSKWKESRSNMSGGAAKRPPRRRRKVNKPKEQQNFVGWIKDMLTCGFADIIETIIAYTWGYVEYAFGGDGRWLAKNIAYYLTGFLTGTINIAYSTIVGIFSYVWNNKVETLFYLAGFAKIMNILKPQQVSMLSPQQIVENKWAIYANDNVAKVVKNADVYTHIQEQLNVNNMNISQIRDQLLNQGMSSSQVQTHLKTYDKIKDYIGGVGNFAGDKNAYQPTDIDGMYKLFYDIDKRKDFKMGFLPGEHVAYLGKVIESYNYALGGYTSDYVGYVMNGIKQAKILYQYGVTFPGVSWVPIKVPGGIWRYGGTELFNVIHIDSLLQYFGLFIFVIRSGKIAIDILSRTWDQAASMNYQCAENIKINHKEIQSEYGAQLQASRYL